jgi:hypothetical protein
VSRKNIQFSDACSQLCSVCEYSPDSLTLLHQKIPAIASTVQYRDAAVTAGEAEGSFAAALLLLHLLRDNGRKPRRKQTKPQEPRPRQLLLVDKHTLGSLEKLLENNRASADRASVDRPSAERACPATFLGANADPRKDLPLLQSCSGLLAAVPDRLIDHVRRGNVKLDRIEHVAVIIPDHREYLISETDIIDARPALESFEQDIRYIFTKFSHHPRTALFTPEELEENPVSLQDLLIRPKKISRSDWQMEKQELPAGVYPVLSPEIEGAAGDGETGEFSQKLEGYFTMKRTLEKNQRQENPAVKELQELIKKVRGDKNPTELQEIRALIRKHVPFSMRTFLAAYLLREHLGSSHGTSSSSQSARNASSRNAGSRKDAAHKAGGYKADGNKASSSKDGTTLFVGIGKKRRIYPKDLARLFQAVDGIGAEDILSIKILENYSFVTVSNETADKAVAGINGTEFRGKPVTCDYARKKD